jgi:hypothetical protein
LTYSCFCLSKCFSLRLSTTAVYFLESGFSYFPIR